MYATMFEIFVKPKPAGTTKIKNFDDNLGSLKVELSREDVDEISNAVPIDEVAGLRHSENHYKNLFQFADTPPLKAK